MSSQAVGIFNPYNYISKAGQSTGTGIRSAFADGSLFNLFNPYCDQDVQSRVGDYFLDKIFKSQKPMGPKTLNEAFSNTTEKGVIHFWGPLKILWGRIFKGNKSKKFSEQIFDAYQAADEQAIKAARVASSEKAAKYIVKEGTEKIVKEGTEQGLKGLLKKGLKVIFDPFLMNAIWEVGDLWKAAKNGDFASQVVRSAGSLAGDLVVGGIGGTIGRVLGGLIGTGIGTVFGGPAGAVAGRLLGAGAGRFIGNMAGAMIGSIMGRKTAEGVVGKSIADKKEEEKAAMAQQQQMAMMQQQQMPMNQSYSAYPTPAFMGLTAPSLYSNDWLMNQTLKYMYS